MSRRNGVIITAGVLLVVVITALGVMQLLPDDAPAGDAQAAEAPPPTAADVSAEFLTAFSSGDAAAAGALTDAPDDATAQLTELWRSLAPTSATASRGTLAESTQAFTMTWTFGPERTWTYESALHLVEKETWRVHWDPALVHPKLTAGHTLSLRDQVGRPAVLDRDGEPLLEWTATGTTAAAPATAPLLLPAMGRLAGQGAWYVALTDDAGTDVAVLHGTKTPAQKSTVSRPVQRAAQAAVDAQQLPTVLVALQPSTGDILAVAQNSAAGGRTEALQGLFPPGSTFKIATATALIEAGAADVGTVVPCPGSATIGQRTVRNADFALGDVPLRTAFAQSCNTSFAVLAGDLPGDALVRAANQLGASADFDIPGIATEVGTVPPAADTTQQVENSIGQGQVRMSPFGVALMSATVARGGPVTPRLWPNRPTEVTTGYDAPPAAVIGSLRTMMREVVTTGRATDLAGLGAVHGKTGTAETSGSEHGWFTGYRDDLAFAVLVQDAGTSTTAVSVTKTFLTGLG
ncbi:penicillin-binding transpeptidase domain-containing protein [Actinophytocola sp. NPDC049390]|uniref:penicillin-binding transpeptidase domain-containing protein n=1 Tax=Actinophytocola sp. NPDC049390 TaxID=3363894 RepID=UPI00378DF946